MLTKFTYLQHVFLFWMIPFVATIIYPRVKQLIMTEKKIIIYGMLIAVMIILIGEPIALRNKAWVYPPEKRSGIDLVSMPIEDFLLYPVVGFCLLVLPLIFIDLEKRKANFKTWIRVTFILCLLGVISPAMIFILNLFARN